MGEGVEWGGGEKNGDNERVQWRRQSKREQLIAADF